ncbi:MAG: exodeoxyribonuclease VII small subunit [Candidatus Latescibacterota bacterium]
MSESPTFEEALAVLENSVARLESGELKLEEALQVFEAGIGASRTCARWLEETRKRVQVLTSDEAGQFHLSFLDDDEAEAESDGE